MKGKIIDPEIKKLILWRIETAIPENFKLIMGTKRAINKKELKKHVEKEDDIGIKYVEMELKFIKALSSGEFTRLLVED